MTKFDKLIVVFLIFGSSLLSGLVAVQVTGSLTCEQFDAEYLNGNCVVIKETK